MNAKPAGKSVYAFARLEASGSRHLGAHMRNPGVGLWPCWLEIGEAKRVQEGQVWWKITPS